MPRVEDVQVQFAAPGGKTGLIAERINNTGELIATDISDSRLDLLKENCKRLNIICVKSALTEKILTNKKEYFDRVLLDAPCTNSGVIRRRLDLRWRMNEYEKKRLIKTQFKLIEKAAGLTKQGGKIVYSTCSIEPEENELLVKRFLTENSGLKLETEQTLHPVEDHTDGAYAAKLVKTAS